MSGQCPCSCCVKARRRARDAETADLKGLAAYDQARTWDRAMVADMRARAMREARERAGATCP